MPPVSILLDERLLILKCFRIMRNCLILACVFSFVGDSALKISVRFFTTLREIAGKREETLEFPEGEAVTVEDVLGKLAERYGKGFTEYVYDGKTGRVKDFLQFLINGRSASTLKGLKTELADGDVLAILPPVGGG
jgi:molybdopterin synthase sulfur carrier subunit